MNRRRFLAALGTLAAGGVAAAAPIANDDAALDATITIQDWRTTGDDHVDAVEFQLTNHRTPRGRGRGTTIQPVVIPWGRGSQAQQNWPIETGPPTLPAGETAAYRVETTHTELRTGHPALLTVYDDGTQQRAWEGFTPTEEADD